MGRSNDRALRFYNEVLGLDRLHYGMWQADDELTMENLKKAQIRYEDFLIEHLPSGTESILDVGCGTGVLARRLLDKGYRVEGLSPDINQRNNFVENIKAPFHHMPFENFAEENKFDVIIMSESCQYIKPAKAFENARRALKPGGHLMICDYFVLDGATGPLSKSGHKWTAFQQRIDESDFKVIKEEDITDRAMPTLDMAKDMVRRIILGLDIATEKVRTRHPHWTGLVKRLFRKKTDKAMKQIDLLDSAKFKAAKAYRFMLLKLDA